MRHRLLNMFAASVLMLGAGTMAAQAANCEGRRDTGTAVGAVAGGVVGNAASRGSLGGTVVGALVGGVAGNAIGGSNCRERPQARNSPRRHYDKHGVAFYYDRDGHRHYYR